MKKILFTFFFFFLFICVKADTLHMIDTSYYWTRTLKGRLQSYHMYDYSFNGKVAYCIEPGVDEGEVYQKGTILDTKLDKKKVEESILYAYYGYDYQSHQTRKYRFATQALIWEVFGISDTVFSKESFKEGDILDVEKEKQEIKALKENHDKKPMVEDMDTYLLSTVTLEDKNHVLSSYEVEENKDVNIEIKEDKLFITPLKEGVIPITLKQKLYTKEEYILYYGDNIQTMITSGLVKQNKVSFNVTAKPYTLTIQKIDRKTNKKEPNTPYASLKGAKYVVYNEKEEIILSTDEEGMAKTKLKKGTYHIKEVKAPVGYTLNEEEQTITIDEENPNGVVTFMEDVIEKEVVIKKVIASTTSSILETEANITFSFYLNNELYIKKTTNEEGILKVTLPFGEYVVKEEDHEKTEKIEDFTLSVKDNKKEILTISNVPISAYLKVYKVDEEGSIIKKEGFPFQIRDKNTNELISFSYTYPKEEEVTVLYTNKEGYFITPEKLKAGDYILEEVDKKIEGYLYNEEKIEFQIKDSNPKEITFQNKRPKGKIRVKKYGIRGNQKEPLKDVIIGLYQNGKLLLKESTNLMGEVIFLNLELGSYEIKEEETVFPYIKEEKIIKVDISYVDQYTKEIEKEVILYNKEKTKTISVPSTKKNGVSIYFFFLFESVMVLLYETIKY